MLDSAEEKIIKAKLIRLMQSATNIRLLQKPVKEYMYYEDDFVSVPEEDDSSFINLIKEYVSSDTIPPKFSACKDLLVDLFKHSGPEGKAVVWARFIDNIESLSQYLKSFGIDNKILYGATPTESDNDQNDVETREEIIRNFHDASCSYKVIIANPYAVGESISLHLACRNAIYLDRDYNAIPFMQSKDRIHRFGLGQDDKVNYYYLLSEGTIDVAIHERLLLKEERMQQVIESEEIPLFKVDRSSDQEFKEDIAALIKVYNDKKRN